MQRTVTTLLALFFLVPAGQALAQGYEIDINALIDETQWTSPDQDRMGMVWWMPTAFWTTSFQDGTMSEAEVQELVDLISGYHIVLAADGQMGAFGGVTYETEQNMRANIAILDNSGVRRSPVDVSTLSPDLQNLLGVMRPMLAGMLGPMGENMHFFVFETSGSDGEVFGDPIGEGTFTVMLDGTPVEWRLPLGSLLAPKICPVDGEPMNGAWVYCPWHGVELVAA